MADPTLVMTFNDLILRVAEYLGIAVHSGDAEVAIPTKAHDLEVCKRISNDGWRMFVNANSRWNWLTPLVQITFDPTGTLATTVDDGNDDQVPRAARYYLPWGFYGQFVSWWTYSPAGPRIIIDNTEESHIRSLYAAASAVTGDPYLCATRPITGGDGRRWEAIFYPTPDSADVITARARLYPDKLVELTDKHSAGFQHDEAVLAAVLAKAELHRNDTRAERWREWEEAAMRSIALDSQSAPRTLGKMTGETGLQAERPYTGVDSYTNSTTTGTIHNF